MSSEVMAIDSRSSVYDGRKPDAASAMQMSVFWRRRRVDKGFSLVKDMSSEVMATSSECTSSSDLNGRFIRGRFEEPGS